jgi:archaemetzincin
MRIVKIVLIVSIFISCSTKNANEDSKKNGKPAIKKEDSPRVEKKQLPILKTNIDIQPFKGISADIVNFVYSELRKVHPDVRLLKPIPLPKRAYYPKRNRYRADTLIYIMRGQTKDGRVTVGLTNKDISTDNGNIPDWGVMGLGYQPGKSCVVSTFRLSKRNLKEQYFKVAIHELGHTQGLPHCPNKTCLMTDAEGKNNTDKENGFCEKCKAFLIAKGWKL